MSGIGEAAYKLAKANKADTANLQTATTNLANGTGLANAAIIPSKTSFLEETENMFDISTAHIGYYYAITGTMTEALTASATYTSFLLPVNGIEVITVSGMDFMYTYYDANGARIGSFGDYSTHANVTFVTTASTRYVGISWKHATYPVGTYAIYKKSATNLFSLTNANVGYYYAITGTSEVALTANAAYTAFLLPTTGNETFIVSGMNFMYTYYAEDGSKIGSFGDYNTHANVIFTTTASTRYVGISWKHATYPNATFSIYKTSVLTYPLKKGFRIPDLLQVVKNNLLQVRKDGLGDFLTVYDAVKYANNYSASDNTFDIKIYDLSTNKKGTEFDILTEMGGSTYLATITDTTNIQKGMPLNDYMKLLGVGKVKLYAHLADTVTLAQSTCFSTIDAFGEVYCENITFSAKNCRYSFHDESNNTRPGKKHSFKKCKFVHLGNAAGLWAYGHAYAAGTSEGNIYDYEDCVFDASGSGKYPWDLHNYGNQQGSKISINGCEMIKAAGQTVSIKLGFLGYSPVTTNATDYEACYNDVFIRNVIANGIIYVSPETAGVCTNGFRLHNFTSLTATIDPDVTA